MSWDVMIFNFAGRPPASVYDMDKSEDQPLGPAAEVRRQITALLPGIDWSVPRLGVYEGEGYSIEFNVGDEDPVNGLVLHVRGGGDAISAITQFARPLGWSALDCSTSEFLDLEHPSQAGWEGFQAFRDRCIEELSEEPPDSHEDR